MNKHTICSTSRLHSWWTLKFLYWLIYRGNSTSETLPYFLVRSTYFFFLNLESVNSGLEPLVVPVFFLLWQTRLLFECYFIAVPWCKLREEAFFSNNFEFESTRWWRYSAITLMWMSVNKRQQQCLHNI